MRLDVLERVLKTSEWTPVHRAPGVQQSVGRLYVRRRQKRLVAMLKERISLIEDDVFGELPFGPKRSRTCKAFDDSGLVLFCSSFFQDPSSRYRVGWTAPGRFYHEVRMAKLTCTPGDGHAARTRHRQFPPLADTTTG